MYKEKKIKIKLDTILRYQYNGIQIQHKEYASLIEGAFRALRHHGYQMRTCLHKCVVNNKLGFKERFNMNKKVSKVVYNWFTDKEGEIATIVEVSDKNIKNIEYHEPLVPGDSHYCDIYFHNSTTVKRVFNINIIEYREKQ